MANVTTGFSKPYVALYAESSGTVTYSSPQDLARGVSVSLSAESASSNDFYADNIVAESVSGVFTGGELTLTVDGLSDAARKLIFNLPNADANGFFNWSDNNPPFVGIGFIVRTMYLGTPGYKAYVFPKCKFNTPNIEARTQEAEISWQTQELTATIYREDTSAGNWLMEGTLRTTEAAAYTDIQAILG